MHGTMRFLADDQDAPLRALNRWARRAWQHRPGRRGRKLWRAMRRGKR